MHYQIKTLALALALALALTLTLTLTIYSFTLPSVWAANEKPLLITASPGKEICQSTDATLGESQIKSELCVTQGSFSHDKYVLNIDGKTLLKGIDDETSAGLSSSYKKYKVFLKCEPQNVFPKETAEQTLAEVQKAMPNSSAEEISAIANLLGTGPGMGMEIGRLCEAKADDQEFMKAQVLFK